MFNLLKCVLSNAIGSGRCVCKASTIHVRIYSLHDDPIVRLLKSKNHEICLSGLDWELEYYVDVPF